MTQPSVAISSHERERTDENFSLRMALLLPAAVTLIRSTITVARNYTEPASGRALPLMDLGSWWYSPHTHLLQTLIAFFALILILIRPRNAWFYFLMFAIGFFEELRWYSVLGAFAQMMPVSMLFLMLTSRMQPARREDLAWLTLSSIFIVSAFYKLNSFYFSGCEFLPGGDFHDGSFRFAQPVLEKLASSRAFVVFSVVVEAGIGMLLLLRQRAGLMAAVLFGPVVALVHPTAAFVVAYSGVFFLCADHRLAALFYKRLLRFRFGIGLLLLGVILTSIFDGSRQTTSLFWLMPLFLVAGLLAQSIWALPVAPPSGRFHGLFFIGLKKPLQWKNPWSLVLVMYALTSLSHRLPVPLGFSMFSGRSCPAAVRYSFDLTRAEVCADLEKQFRMGLWESKIVYNWRDGRAVGCTVSAPTESSLNILLESARSAEGTP